MVSSEASRDVFLDLRHLLVGQLAFQQIDTGGAHQRTLALTDELDALGGRISALVELAGQILDSERYAVRLGQLIVGTVDRRLAEDRVDALVEECFVDALDVVTVQQAQTCQLLDAQQRDQLTAQTLCLDIKAGLLFNINTIYHRERPSCYFIV